MEFLRSLLRPRFARAQVATSRDVGCFLRLHLRTENQAARGRHRVRPKCYVLAARLLFVCKTFVCSTFVTHF